MSKMGASKRDFTQERERSAHLEEVKARTERILVDTREPDPVPPDGKPWDPKPRTYRTTQSAIRKALKDIGVEAKVRYMGARPGSEFVFQAWILRGKATRDQIIAYLEYKISCARVRRSSCDVFTIWTREEAVKYES